MNRDDARRNVGATRVRLVGVLALVLSAGAPARGEDKPASTFGCPKSFDATPGWSMSHHDCGPDVTPPVAVFISATSDDGKRQTLYGLCCYADRSLVRRAPVDFSVSGPQWKRVKANVPVTDRHIERYVCGQQYTGVAFEDCRYASVEPVETPSAQMQLGAKVFTAHCASCHKSDGAGMPPIIPALKGSGVATGSPEWMIPLVQHGIPGTIMLSFGGKEPDDPLTNEDLAAVITYVRNAWGNADKRRNGPQAGGSVTAADVARAAAQPKRP